MSEDVREARKQVVVAMLSEDPALRKFVKAFLEVYSEPSDYEKVKS